jgi:hypothetical protein
VFTGFSGTGSSADNRATEAPMDVDTQGKRRSLKILYIKQSKVIVKT